MSLVLLIVAPVFGLIVLGYGLGRAGVLSPAAEKGIAEFSFTIAVPALLFRTLAKTPLPEVDPLAIWASYFGGVVTTWAVATLLTRFVLRRPAADGAAIAMSSMYGNVVMLGIPLALSTLGPEAAGPIALILSLHTPFVWLVATTHMQIAGGGAAQSLAGTLRTLAADLLCNPIILAILAGSLWRLGGVPLPTVADQMLAMLTQAAIPASLVALGLSLVTFRVQGQAPTLATIVVLKLVLMPAVAWLIAAWVMGLPPVAQGVVLIFAAMPSGANAFLFAARYGRAVNSASGAVALGTALAALTASAIVVLLKGD